MNKSFLVLLLLAACATRKAGPGSPSKPASGPKGQALGGGPPPGAGPGGEEYQGPRGMEFAGEIGVLDGGDVEDVIRAGWRDIRRCYDRAGAAQKYAAGKVMLKFLVHATGATADVLVVDSGLGSWDVERCLVEVGKRLRFPEPGGRKPTTFEYPVEFRSTGELRLVTWATERVDKDATPLLAELAPCGALGRDDVAATFYVEPSGAVGAAGLAAPGPFDLAVGACVVERIRAWKLPREAPRTVARVILPLRPPPGGALAPPGPPPPPPRVRHRKRR